MNEVVQYIKSSLAGYYPETEACAMARVILEREYGFGVLELYGAKERLLSSHELDRLHLILERLCRYEPLQYVLGKTTFMGLEFDVAPGVLIPRPETEELVSWMLDDLKSSANLTVMDIGTGSGCIAVALAVNLPRCRVVGIDNSERALNQARGNAKKNNVLVDFRLLDLHTDEIPPADVVVSNPPYVTMSERGEMEPNVLKWEPACALFVPDEDPLYHYRKLARLHANVLYLEINRAYGKAICQLLCDEGYEKIELKKDLSGNDRMIKAER